MKFCIQFWIMAVKFGIYFSGTCIFIQVSCLNQIDVRPEKTGFTEPFFRRITGKMVLFDL